VLFYWLIFLSFAAGAILYRVQGPQPAYAGPDWRTAPPSHFRSVAPVAVGLFLIVVIGLRFHVGGDWHNYEIAYDRIRIGSFGEALTRSKQEFGFVLINWVGAQFGWGIWFVNLLCAVPFSWGLVMLCRQQPNPWLALLVATPFLIVVVGMGFTRQAAAIGFLMIGIAEYIEKKSILRFVAYSMAGALFHRTVLVFVPIILLSAGRNKAISVLLAIFAVVIAYFTIYSTAVEAYAPGYLNGRYDAAGASVRVLMNILPALLLLATKDRMYRSREEKVVWKTFAILALLAGVALFAVSSSVIVDRLAMYLIPLQMFVLGRISLLFSKSGGSDVLWRALVIAYSAAVLFVWLNYGHFAGGWLPYRNYLTAPQ
jgi:hypothetical protein